MTLPSLDTVFHVVTGLLGLAGLAALVFTWRGGKLVDVAATALGLKDPDGRISNKKVLATAVTGALMIGFLSGAAKSVATQGDLGPNLLFLGMGLLGGVVTHAGVQQKIGGGTPPPERRSSQAIAQPAEAKEQ